MRSDRGYHFCDCCGRSVVKNSRTVAKYSKLEIDGLEARVCHACNPPVASVVDVTLELLCNPDTTPPDEYFAYAMYGYVCLTGGEELLF